MNHLSAKTSLYLDLFPWDPLPQAVLLSPRDFKREFNLEVSILGRLMNKKKIENHI